MEKRVRRNRTPDSPRLFLESRPTLPSATRTGDGCLRPRSRRPGRKSVKPEHPSSRRRTAGRQARPWHLRGANAAVPRADPLPCSRLCVCARACVRGCVPVCLWVSVSVCVCLTYTMSHSAATLPFRWNNKGHIHQFRLCVRVFVLVSVFVSASVCVCVSLSVCQSLSLSLSLSLSFTLPLSLSLF